MYLKYNFCYSICSKASIGCPHAGGVKKAGRSWMRESEDPAKHRVIGEVYV